MENENIKTIEDIQSQRMYLQVQELKILLNNAKDSITGKVLLNDNLQAQVLNILKSLLENPKHFINACVLLHLELGAETTVSILNDRGDYQEYSSMLEQFTLKHAEICCSHLELKNEKYLDENLRTGEKLEAKTKIKEEI